jgi:hypothetical protein
MQRRPNATRLREDNGDGLTATTIEINELKLMSKRRRDAVRRPAAWIFICLVIVVCFALEFKVWPPNLVTTSTSTESASSARIGVPVSQSGRIPQPQESTTTSGRAQRDNATAGSEANPFKFAKDDPERAPILRILEQGGYNLNTKSIFNDETLALLPKWSKVQQFYGPPKIVGLEKCKEFQKIPLKDLTMDIAGMFNSGTNLLTDLLTINCINTDRIFWARNHRRASNNKLGLRVRANTCPLRCEAIEEKP